MLIESVCGQCGESFLWTEAGEGAQVMCNACRADEPEPPRFALTLQDWVEKHEPAFVAKGAIEATDLLDAWRGVGALDPLGASGVTLTVEKASTHGWWERNSKRLGRRDERPFTEADFLCGSPSVLASQVNEAIRKVEAERDQWKAAALDARQESSQFEASAVGLSEEVTQFRREATAYCEALEMTQRQVVELQEQLARLVMRERLSAGWEDSPCVTEGAVVKHEVSALHRAIGVRRRPVVGLVTERA